jgi:hypothetical protein
MKPARATTHHVMAGLDPAIPMPWGAAPFGSGSPVNA